MSDISNDAQVDEPLPDARAAGRARHASPLQEAGRADLLRLVTCGSVDDGKSTLIGRLLFDTKQVFVDQMEAVEETSERRGDGYVNLALLTDGLRHWLWHADGRCVAAG